MADDGHKLDSAVFPAAGLIRNHEFANTDTAKSTVVASYTLDVQPTIYTATVSGGITLGGEAATLQSVSYTASVSGGIQFAGSASLARSYAPLVSGGITFSGAATTSLVPAGAAVEYPYTPSGGIEFGGAAETSFVSGIEPEQEAPQPTTIQFNTRSYLWRADRYPSKPRTYWRIYSYIGLGGVILGGSAKVNRVKAVKATGLLKMRATAACSKSIVVKSRALVLMQGAAKTEYVKAQWLVEEEEFLRLIA